MARIPYICIILSGMAFCSNAMADSSGQVTYTNPRAQAVGQLLQLLSSEDKDATGEPITRDDLKEMLEPKEEAPDPYLNPKVVPVQAAPRVVDEKEKKEPKYQPNSVNSGGIGNVGGLGHVGSTNVKPY